MRHEASRALFGYWNRVRRGRATPDRNDIDPAAIRTLLADTFLLEPGRDGRFAIRLSGTRLDALRLGDLKGQSFLELWGEDNPSVAAALWAAMDDSAPVIMGVKTAPQGRREVGAEALILPLRYHGKTHERLLGMLTLGQTPSWIGLLPIERLRLVSLRMIEPSTWAESRALRRADEQSSETLAPPLPDRRAHLTVYEGGRP